MEGMFSRRTVFLKGFSGSSFNRRRKGERATEFPFKSVFSARITSFSSAASNTCLSRNASSVSLLSGEGICRSSFISTGSLGSFTVLPGNFPSSIPVRITALKRVPLVFSGDSILTPFLSPSAIFTGSSRAFSTSFLNRAKGTSPSTMNFLRFRTVSKQ